MSSMVVKLWGVRGSIPAPGRETVFYGGNTTCLSVETDDSILIFDAGSGIRKLGLQLAPTDKTIYLVITHDHWDHIQGFPFFVPIYQPGHRVFILPYHRGKETLCTLFDQMDGLRFPVTPEQLLSENECVVDDQLQFLEQAGFRLEMIETNHPGGCHGYRVFGEHGSLVFIPDNEVQPPGPKTAELGELAAFCQGADVLIHDAQYLPSDMPHKHGWGHSVLDDVLDLAAAAQPRQLILFHHDPERTDAQVAALQEQARGQLNKRAPNTGCAAAREGMVFRI
jgi:phosphoribosyl 1,2-cyclic phosphodiesterase